MSSAAAGAAKRLAHGTVNWSRFAQAVPEEYSANFALLHARAINVQSMPSELPKIDFATYKAGAPGLSSVVADFENKYGKVTVSYPSGAKQLAAIDHQEKEDDKDTAGWIERSKARVAKQQKAIDEWDHLPPVEHMTFQEWNYYFPGLFPDAKTKSFFALSPVTFDVANSPDWYYYMGNYRVRGGYIKN